MMDRDRALNIALGIASNAMWIQFFERLQFRTLLWIGVWYYCGIGWASLGIAALVFIVDVLLDIISSRESKEAMVAKMAAELAKKG